MTQLGHATSGRRDELSDPRVVDPTEQMVTRHHLEDATVEECVEVLDALRALRDAEAAQLDHSRRSMELGDTDMRAIRFLMAMMAQSRIVTPSLLAEHLGITTSSVTKMLDRLERAGHIERQRHPSDRRALSIIVVDELQRRARSTIGRYHAERFDVVAAMSSEERRAVVRLLERLREVSERAVDADAA